MRQTTAGARQATTVGGPWRRPANARPSGLAARWPAAALALALSACGGGGGDDRSPTAPPEPPSVASVAVEPRTDSVAVGGAARFNARVADAGGGPVAATVLWTSGDPAVASVSASGEATGLAPGVAAIVATAGARADTALLTVLGGPEARFDIELVYLTEVSARVDAALLAARARWQAAIVGDLPDVPGPFEACGPAPADSAGVDDLRLYVSLDRADGPGRVLAAAAPCAVREGTFLPATGIVHIDKDDVDFLVEQGQLEGVILHEMAHAMGFGGRLWLEAGVLRGDCPGAPYFDGEGARRAFDAAGGGGFGEPKVPVEGNVPPGGRCTHWRESVMGRELMTPFLREGEPEIVSAITIRSFEELGYTVDPGAADPFFVPVVATVVAPDGASAGAREPAAVRPGERRGAARTAVADPGAAPPGGVTLVGDVLDVRPVVVPAGVGATGRSGPAR